MRKIALVLASLVVALLAAEGMIRLLGAAPEVGWVEIGRYRLAKNPRIGFEPIPHLKTVAITNDLIDYVGESNRLGFRDRDHAVAKPPGVYRIVVLGDSVGLGLKVARTEDTFPALLEKILRRRGKNAEVINLSVTGYNTQQEVESFLEKGLAFSPDLVLVAYTLSDRERLDGNIMETLLSAARIGPQRKMRQANPILVHSALYRFLLFRVVRPKGSHTDEAETKESERALAAISGDTVAPSFSRLAQAARAHHFHVLVAVFPYFVHLTQGYEYRPQHASAIRDAKSHGFGVVDLLVPMQRCRKKAGRPIQVDSFHPNELGHRCAAGAIAQSILNSPPDHAAEAPATQMARWRKGPRKTGRA